MYLWLSFGLSILFIMPLLSYVLFNSTKKLLNLTFISLLIPFIISSSLLMAGANYETFKIFNIISLVISILFFFVILFVKYKNQWSELLKRVLWFLKKYRFLYLGIALSVILWLFVHSYSQDQNAYLKFGIEYIKSDKINSLLGNRTYAIPNSYYSITIFGYKNMQYFYNVFIPLFTLSIFIWSSVSIFENNKKVFLAIQLLLYPLLFILPSLLDITTRANIVIGSLLFWIMAMHLYNADESNPLLWISLITFSSTSIVILLICLSIIICFFAWNKKINLHILIALFCTILYSLVLIKQNTVPYISVLSANIIIISSFVLFKYKPVLLTNNKSLKDKKYWKKISLLLILMTIFIVPWIIFFVYDSNDTLINNKVSSVIKYDFIFGDFKNPNIVTLGILVPMILISFVSLDKRAIMISCGMSSSFILGIFLANKFPEVVYSYLPFRIYSSMWVISGYISLFILFNQRKDIFILFSSITTYALLILVVTLNFSSFITFGSDISYNKETIPTSLINYVDSNKMSKTGKKSIFSDFAISKTSLKIEDSQIEYFLPFEISKYSVDYYNKTLYGNNYYYIPLHSKWLASEFYSNTNVMSRINNKKLSYIIFDKSRHISKINNYKKIEEGKNWIIFKRK